MKLILFNFFRIFQFLFYTNKKQNTIIRALLLLLRFTWELPQLIIGVLIAVFLTLTGKTLETLTYHGVILIVCKNRFGGFSLGPVIIGDSKLKADVNNGLFQHEFGHCIQSSKSGFIYLFKYALPSLISSIRYESDQHDKHKVEQNANTCSKKYFEKYGGDHFIWNHSYNPIYKEITPLELFWYDFLPGHFPVGHIFIAFKK